jgi:hypothetical protein
MMVLKCLRVKLDNRIRNLSRKFEGQGRCHEKSRPKRRIQSYGEPDESKWGHDTVSTCSGDTQSQSGHGAKRRAQNGELRKTKLNQNT